ncbi:MAG: hypothetical protein ACE5JH_02465 [Acidobacteriota bacterium]
MFVSAVRRTLAPTVLLAALVGVGCEDSDTIPPEGSTITVTGNPSTIVLGNIPECDSLLSQEQCGTAEVVATVSNELGVPLPGQDVRFSSSAGLLFLGEVSNATPVSNIPIETDGFGNARVNLVTATTATVTARSGSAMDDLTFNTVQGNLRTILLNVDTSDPTCDTQTITSCAQDLCLVAQAFDTSSNPLDGVTIVFELRNNVSAGGNTFNGTFTPLQVLTSGGGVAASRFTPDSTCPSECSQAQGGGPCQGEIVARTQGGAFESTALQLFINIQ